MGTRFRILIGTGVLVLLMSGTAVGTTYVTGSGIQDETITAADLGPDVTRVKAVTLTIPSEPDVTEQRCFTNPDGIEECGEYVLPEATTKTRSITCPGGNVMGGGVKLLDDGDMWNLTVESYPASDSSWAYTLYNSGPDDITVQLRVVCI